MVDVKQAVDGAMAYFAKLMTVRDKRLEEVELSDDERTWHVTLSGLVQGEQKPEFVDSALGGLFTPPYERVYKVFAVDSETGSVRSMRIRQVA
jgi:hypothetical protein